MSTRRGRNRRGSAFPYLLYYSVLDVTGSVVRAVQKNTRNRDSSTSSSSLRLLQKMGSFLLEVQRESCSKLYINDVTQMHRNPLLVRCRLPFSAETPAAAASVMVLLTALELWLRMQDQLAIAITFFAISWLENELRTFPKTVSGTFPKTVSETGEPDRHFQILVFRTKLDTKGAKPLGRDCVRCTFYFSEPI